MRWPTAPNPASPRAPRPKGQRLEFVYDAYNRVTEVRTGPAGATNLFRKMIYDQGTNGMGRLSAIEYEPDYSGQYELREGFSYTPGGLPSSKSLSYKIVNSIVTVAASFAYNNEGQRTAITYPRGWSDASGTWVQDPAITYESSFNDEARLTGLTRKQAGHPVQVIASGATYNLNGQMLTATIQGAAHAWQYNVRGQLTRETAGSLMDFEYTFSATENDGRVTRRKDYISGEDVQFQYDVLGRLSSATATGAGVAWSQSFTHDGFGNLTQRSGSGTPLSVTVNEKNQVTNVGYDANGNQTSIGSHGLTYDVENRLVAVTNVANIGTESYGYSVRGERLLVEHTAPGNSTPFAQELRFYDTNSQLLAAFDVVCAPPCANANAPHYPVEKTDKKRVYFAGKLVKVGAQAAVTDRLGSLIAHGSTRYRYYPYGEAIGTQEWDKPQFATYTRDGSSGLDDAMNRQYDRIWGRFTSPDPYQASGGPADPGSWNRYVYVQGDPVNYADPLGLDKWDPNTNTLQGDGPPNMYYSYFGAGAWLLREWLGLNNSKDAQRSRENPDPRKTEFDCAIPQAPAGVDLRANVEIARNVSAQLWAEASANASDGDAHLLYQTKLLTWWFDMVRHGGDWDY